MPRLTKIYTRTGDDGTTGLGSKARVSKNHPRVVAYGTVDELSSQIGVVLSHGPSVEVARALTRIQNDLFDLGSELCIPEEDRVGMAIPCVEQPYIERLEAWIDGHLEGLPALDNFILPGGTPVGAGLHLARTICRRAERCLVTLSESESVGSHAMHYLNRLSDLLFVMARSENRANDVAETLWASGRVSSGNAGSHSQS